jgi:hypothetical protein
MSAAYLRGVVVGWVALAACGRRGREAERAETVIVVSAPATTAGAPHEPFFDVLGHNAENAYDQIKAADWGAARASVDSIRAGMLETQPQDTANRGADLRRSLDRLDSAVVHRSRRQALSAANYLTKLGALLALGHDAAMPPEVTLLDYYGRELEIWAEARDSVKLSETAVALRGTWDELRPRVVERGGTDEAEQFDSVVASVIAARTPAQYGKTASPVLDQVDMLEVVFNR